MNVFIQGHPGAPALLLLLVFVKFTTGQDFGEKCLAKFHKGKDDFILDTDGSVKGGARFLSAPALNRYRDCLTACCKQPSCNVAFMERQGDEEGLIKTCVLFDCLYKNKYACHFVKKKGYMTYVVDSIYEHYRDVDAISEDIDNPPVANAGPDRVVRPNESVTLSGIQSTDDHEIKSFSWKIIGDYPDVRIEKTTFPDEIYVSNLKPGTYKFELTVTDIIDQSDLTTITVLVLTNEQTKHHCMVPMKPGPCRGSFPRWHYNAASGNCETFNFGGCFENLNNYLTKEECNNACDGTEKVGGSTKGLPVPSKEKCGVECTGDQFTCDNGCCLDPGLKCDSTAQCSDGSDEQECDEFTKTFRMLQTIAVDEQKTRCTELPDTGTCRDSYSKWYYDPFSRSCRRFNYGGCGGNDNRFDSEQICKNFCRNVTETDVFTRKEGFDKQESDGHIDSLPIIITLALFGAILLGVLGYCFIKKRSHKQQHVNVVNTRDRERLVYNSTTKPI